MKILKLKDLSNLKKCDYNNIILLPTSLITYLQSIKLPIKEELAYKQISLFLNFINNRIEEENKTVFIIEQNEFISHFQRNTYTKFKEILSKCNIVTNVTNIDGVWYNHTEGIAKTYRIHNEYLNDEDYSIILFNAKNTNKILEIEYKGNEKLINTIIEEELNYEKVFIEELKYHKENNTSKFNLYLRILKALSLSKKRYIKQGKKVDRVYHSFSNLSKITRKCFVTNFFNLDIKNSQPTFLVQYLQENNIKFEKEYKEVVESGKFYELFYDLVEETDLEKKRKLVKQGVYKSFLFDFKENRRYTKRLKELFPLVHDELKRLNENNITLASILQNLEARLFNNLDIKHSKKFFTLFDAIYFNNKKDITYISKQIKQFGKENNIKFTLEIEGLNKLKQEKDTNILETKETVLEEIKTKNNIDMKEEKIMTTETPKYSEEKLEKIYNKIYKDIKDNYIVLDVNHYKTLSMYFIDKIKNEIKYQEDKNIFMEFYEKTLDDQRLLGKITARNN